LQYNRFMGWRVLVVPLVVTSIAACSPYGAGAFACTDSSQCSGGTCTAGYCAFADSTCSSGERYGAASGPMSNACVGAVDMTADAPNAVDDAPMQALDAFQFEDAPLPTMFCYGSGLAQPCFTTMPTGDTTLANDIDTDTSSSCQATIGNQPWCTIAANTITVAATLRITGGKPLVLVGIASVTITGELNVASTRAGGEVQGASDDFAMCNKGTPPANSAGGAGGSFGGTGGNGGDGTNNAGHGVAGATQTPSAMRGGCPGQAGAGGTGGAAGHGGGALALISNTTISIPGTINASGEGGAGGKAPSSGGGGGGAGGLIVLDAPAVTSVGQVFANGGGGAEASGVTSNDGANGNDPGVGGAAGTNGASSGGQGGAGGFGMTAAAPGQSVAGHAGGGGGGGVGVIKLYRATSISGGTISPPPST
jgi:hypothetical protein